MLSGFFISLACVQAGYSLFGGGGKSVKSFGLLEKLIQNRANEALVYTQSRLFTRSFSNHFSTGVFQLFTSVGRKKSTPSTSLTITTTNYI